MVLKIREDTVLVGVDSVVHCDIGLTGVTSGRDVTVETFFRSFRAGGPGGTRRHCIQGGGVRECCHPVDSGLHILLPRDICSTVWH